MGSEQVDEELCWVCLAGAEQGELAQPCKCPRLVHPKCLARWAQEQAGNRQKPASPVPESPNNVAPLLRRWQLQSAGKSEESKCRFCGAVLPDWRPVRSWGFSLGPACTEPGSTSSHA